MTNPQRLLEQRSAFLAQPCGYADVAQLVERWLPKPKVAGSRPVVRFPSNRHESGYNPFVQAVFGAPPVTGRIDPLHPASDPNAGVARGSRGRYGVAPRCRTGGEFSVTPRS